MDLIVRMIAHETFSSEHPQDGLCVRFAPTPGAQRASVIGGLITGFLLSGNKKEGQHSPLLRLLSELRPQSLIAGIALLGKLLLDPDRREN